jgi:hypothetical protein
MQGQPRNIRYIEDGKEEKRQQQAFRAMQREGLRQGIPADELTTRQAIDGGVLDNCQEINQLFADLALQRTPHLVIYFHGGLVDASSAKDAVIPFNNRLQQAGMTPLFWIWNSDAATELRDTWQTFRRTLQSNLSAGLAYGASKIAELFQRHPTPFWLRYLRRRRHKLAFHPKATYLEEMLRGTVVGNFIKALWSEMKEDIADAFQPHHIDLRAGTYFLDKLAHAITTPAHPPLKVSLIGHSGGAIYVCAMLQAAALRRLPFQFEHIVLWAAGVTFPQFHDTLLAYPDYYRTFHLFGMQDVHERVDAIRDPYGGIELYPQSLLYWVSGVLEGADVEPLVGLQTYVEPQEPHPAFNTALHQAVRAYLNEAGRSHWLDSLHHHGGFVKDQSPNGVVAQTLEILKH